MAVLADHALVDQQGKLSAIGIWRHVTLSEFPGVHQRAHLVLLLTGRRDEVGEHRVSLSLRDPDGELTLEHNGALQMAEPPAGITEVEAPGIIVLDLPIQRPGRHAIVVAIDGAEEARVEFTASAQIRPGGKVH
jgi:hypothetical protein